MADLKNKKGKFVMAKRVAIVLVNYNGENFQKECIESIYQMEYKDYDIIIVDNGSKDNSVEVVRKNFKYVIIIETNENNGVAKGNNIGIEYALNNGYEYVLLLNNDTEVDKKMLGEMIKKASENTLVTCKMYYYSPQNTIWYGGGKINWNKGTTIHFGMNELDNDKYNESKFIEYTPTCCLLIHKSVFEKIGIMDEKYFMYYDDTDFCARVNYNGFKIWYESKAKLWHKVSSSSGGEDSPLSIYYCTRNRLYFIEKHCKNKIVPNLFFYFTRVIRYIQCKDKLKRKIMIKAIKDYNEKNMYMQNLDLK